MHLERFLKIERDARQVETVAELAYLAANETATLARASQVFVLAGRGRKLTVQSISSIGRIEKDAPRVRWIESVVARLGEEAGLEAVREFEASAYSAPDDTDGQTYPYRHALWVPFKLRNDSVFGGLLLSRDSLWTQEDIGAAKRLAETYQHAWSAITGTRKLRRKRSTGLFVLVGALALLAAGFYPVPLTVIAPVEVRSLDLTIVAAPLDGVVDEIAVNPNEMVRAGQVIARMRDTTFRNELAVASREVQVAEAKLKQLTQLATDDPKARADLAVARTEMALAVAKRDYADELLQRTAVVSPSMGLAIFSDKQDLIGRPFRTGERLMDIANPNKVQLRIDVAAADVIAISEGAPVRAFLDSDPINPFDGQVSRMSFEAKPTAANTLAYRIYAALDKDDRRLPRLGVRGSAQIFGRDVPLAFYLFRRPLSSLRQQFGL